MLPCKQKRLLPFHLQCDKLWQTQALAKIISDPFAVYFRKHLHGMDVFLKPQSQQLQDKRWSAIQEQHPLWFPIVHKQAEICRARRRFQFSNESIPAHWILVQPTALPERGILMEVLRCVLHDSISVWMALNVLERKNFSHISLLYELLSSICTYDIPWSLTFTFCCQSSKCLILCKSIFGSYFFLSVLYMLLRFLTVFYLVTVVYFGLGTRF